MRHILVILFLQFGWIGYNFATEPPVTEKPNIILFFADDAGYADFGFQPNVDEIMSGLTPNIDSIASDGARFSNAYVCASVCSPSRAGMLTGRYQQRFGHERNIPPGYMQGGLSLDEQTIADRMKAIGYRTACIGKWHLGYPADYQPNQRGFEHFFGCLQGSRSYFPMKRVTPHRVIQFNGEPTQESGYVTDRFGDAAVEFIDNQKDKPFFLFLSFTAPHGPMHAKQNHLDQLGHISNVKRRAYAGMVKSMDENIGKVLAALKKNSIEKNTLIVFTNDNGGQTLTGAINAPLRGRKGTLFEGGIRVPMAISWPDRIKPGDVIEQPVSTLDFMPTFLSAAGEQADPKWKLDGQNIIPLVTGQDNKSEERPLFWRSHGKDGESAVRLGRWKLHRANAKPETSLQLFDLDNDISESTDLANRQPEKVRELSKLLADWQSELIEPMWGSARKRRPRKNKN